jgi:hypothetical protein
VKRFLNWLLCHNVMIVVGLFVLTAWMFRVEIFGLEEKEKPAVNTPAPMPAAETPVVKLVSPSADTFPGLESQVSPVQSMAAEKSPAPVIEEKPAEPPAETALVPAPAQAQVAAESPPQAETRPPHQPAAADADTTVVKFPESAKDTPEKVLQRNDYQFRDAQTTQAAPAEMDLLQKARQAYWNDDLQKSRSLYQAYIELNPENPDGFGELGNLLSTLGDLDTAAQMYRRAADLLIARGETEQAARLMDVLDSIEVIQKTAK